MAGKKKTKIKKTAKLTLDKQIVTDLASCVLWALKYLTTKYGGGLWMEMNTLKSKAWEEKFMDALDGVGYCIDRKAFWKKRDEPSSGRRRTEKPSRRKRL